MWSKHRWIQAAGSFWNRTIDGYLSGVDALCATNANQSSAVQSALQELSWGDTRIFLRFTVAGLLFVFAIILCSCTTHHHRLPLPHMVPVPSPVLEKEPQPLYTKRDTIVISPRHSGSPTGSIFADTEPRWELLADARPNQIGEVITVKIPDDLQFTPEASGKGDAAKPPSENKSADPAAQAALPAFDNTVNPEPVKELRMEIIAMEPTGSVYLRGVREFRNQRGELHRAVVTAKVPRRELNGYEIDARTLTAVAVNEENNGTLSDYTSTAWDKTVSRRLAGFVPDVAAEYSMLEDARRSLEARQKALQDQARALAAERERIVKERQRTAAVATAKDVAAKADGKTTTPAEPATPAAPEPTPTAQEAGK